MRSKDQILLENLYSEMTEDSQMLSRPLRIGNIFILNDHEMVNRFENKDKKIKRFYVLNRKSRNSSDSQSYDGESGEVVGSAINLNSARNIRDRKDVEYGSYVHFIVGQYDDNTFALF